MVVRNFYVEADIDGRQTTLGGGPKSKDGGMTVLIHQRHDGDVVYHAVKIRCTERDGKLMTEVFNHEGICVYCFETER